MKTSIITCQFLLFCSVTIFAQNQKANWDSNATPNMNTFVTGNPMKIIEEDFTDGAFDNVNSGVAGENYLHGGNLYDGIAFRAPNDRTGFTNALSRKISEGVNGPWGGAIQWWQYKDASDKSRKNAIKYFIDKYDDVVFVKYKAFSDIADGHEIYHAQITLMNYNEAFLGNPHYDHDISIEVDQYFQGIKSPIRQLAGNVNVIKPSGSVGCINKNHYTGNSGYATPSDLNKEYQNEVVWRAIPSSNKVNIEQWGTIKACEYDLNTGLNNRLDNNSFDIISRYAVFNYIQFTFFCSCNGKEVTTPAVIRSGITTADAQIGFMNASVYITKKSDFNLDLNIDQMDADVLNTNWGYSGGSIKTGDANNDTNIDIEDANPLVAFWSNPINATASASAQYNSTTGEITLNMQNVSFFKIESKSGKLNGISPDLSGLSETKYSDSDSRFGSYTTSTFNIIKNFGAIAATGIPEGDLTVTFNYLGSGVADGFTIPLKSIDAILTPPTTTDFLKYTYRDQALSLSLSDFSNGYADVNQDKLTGIKIIQLPINGILKLNNTMVNQNQEIGVADMQNLNYIPNFNFTGTDAFQWTATDGTGYSNPTMANIKVQVFMSISLTPTLTKVSLNSFQTFSALALDQDGVALANQPTFTYAVTSAGSIGGVDMGYSQNNALTAHFINSNEPFLFTAQATVSGVNLISPSAQAYITNPFTAIDPLPAKKIKVYPNPASDKVTIETGSTDIMPVSIFDLNGRVLLQKEVSGNVCISLNQLSKGIYILSVGQEKRKLLVF
ncbi:MAG: T9SS type A sorting domain-containing protein [Paludibacter sp.]|nr:T9SS type A sorting domain-containing protein [Paludibacter sp.]